MNKILPYRWSHIGHTYPFHVTSCDLDVTTEKSEESLDYSVRGIHPSI